MSFSRFIPSNSNCPSGNKPVLYTESENAVESSEEDIEEFARRIGIDPQTEPHLMNLARQGLTAKLPPDWKPCKDEHRDVWFYYNTKTHKSQWDHPMDGIYRDKVVEARQEHAMNRIQSFDLTSAPKPLKSLPPLKKSGGGLSPISFPSTLSKLGPLRNSSFSSSDDLSQFSGSQRQPPPLSNMLQPIDPLKKSLSLTGSNGLGKSNNNNGNSSSNGNNNNNGSSHHLDNRDLISNRPPRVKMEPAAAPPAAPAPIKKVGLTLTGSGANFLKSAKPLDSDLTENVSPPSEKVEQVLENCGLMRKTNTVLNNKSSNITNKDPEDSSRYFQPQVPDDSPSPVGFNESSISETGSGHGLLGKPLKSILSHSLKNRSARLDENSSSSSAPRANLWDISPKDMTDEEFELWNSLDYKRKASVKFNLDDPALVFEFERDETDNPNDSDEEENSESEEGSEEEEDEEEQEEEGMSRSSNDVSRSLLGGDNNKKPNVAGESVITVPTAVNRIQNHREQGGVQNPQIIQQNNISFTPGNSGEAAKNNVTTKDIVLDRATMKANMEKQVKEYQDKLEEEKQQQEQQIKTNTEEKIRTIKSDMESAIAKTKADFESHKKTEIDKARKEMETSLLADVEKLRDGFKEKLSKRKLELVSEHQTEIQEIETQTQEQLKRIKTDPRLLEAGKEYERQLGEEIKQLKQTMDDQHRKQVEEMKSLHTSSIQKLREEFRTEEAKLKKEHGDIIADMISKFESEKQNLLRSFEVEQGKIKEEFSLKASQLTADLTQQLEAVKNDFQGKKLQLENSVSNVSVGSVGPSTTEASFKVAALKQAEEELAALRSKYSTLEVKYSNLKKGVQSVVTSERSKLPENPPRSDSFVIESPPPLHHHNHNDTDSGAAESDTSYSMSSSGGPVVVVNQIPQKRGGVGGGGGESDQDERFQRIMTGNNDRLSLALRALDELKQQILDIKAEQKGGNKKSISEAKHEKLDSEEPCSHTEEIQVLHSRKKPTNVHNATLPLTANEVRVAKARGSRSATSSSPQPQTKVVSASVRDISDDRHYIVDEAKDFIKTQKYRLKRSGLSFGTPVSTSVGARHRQDYKLNSIHSNRSSESQDRSPVHSSSTLNHYNSKALRNQHQQDHHLHSETESSGVGSLKESSGEKSKISQDIEGILTSLQQLDGQMKYLWSVVGSTPTSISAPSLLSVQQPLATSTPSRPSLDSSTKPKLETKLLGSSGFKDPNSYSDLEMKYNLAPNLITPGNQALINSINAVNSIHFRRSLDLTSAPAVTTLEEHVNNIRNRQSRILKQYPLPGESSSSNSRRDPSPSISERTKDLREWLEKF